MAGVKISELPSLDKVTGKENLAVEIEGSNGKMSTDILLNSVKTFLIQINNVNVKFSDLEKAINEDKILLYEDSNGIYPVVMANIATTNQYIDISTVTAQYNQKISIVERRLSNNNELIKVGGDSYQGFIG